MSKYKTQNRTTSKIPDLIIEKAKLRFEVTSKNVIPAKAGIQNVLRSLDSCWSLPRTRIRGRSDEFGIIRGSLKFWKHIYLPMKCNNKVNSIIFRSPSEDDPARRAVFIRKLMKRVTIPRQRRGFIPPRRDWPPKGA
jgi:hypothetical protein